MKDHIFSEAPDGRMGDVGEHTPADNGGHGDAPFGAAHDAETLLQRLFAGFDGKIAMRLWSGSTLALGRGALAADEPPFTLHWVARLEHNHARALQHVSEATYRIWRLYMTTCALEFESGEIGVYQVLAGKRAGCTTLLPLTRRHLYP